jgi:NAD(P)-dependent dehydrogenase (short-subunit alcohol dehydrogenase family)
MKRLAGKWALVTGSTRGLGRTTAEWLAKEGANIVVSGRGDEPVAESVAAMQALGVEAIGIPADLSDYHEAHRLAAETFAAVPKLDILVNNAGMSTRMSFWEYSDHDWDYQTNVNLRSPFILAQAAAKNFIANETRGRIVNVSTIGATHAHADAAIYNLNKAGQEAMTRNMAFELGPYGCSVNCVAPGAMANKPGTPPRPQAHAYATKFIPFGRVGSAEDIAAAVLFFCLPESEFTTGQTLLVDGAHASYLPEREKMVTEKKPLT